VKVHPNASAATIDRSSAATFGFMVALRAIVKPRERACRAALKQLRHPTVLRETAATAPRSSLFLFVFEAAALKTWINPGGNFRPQSDLHREQRVDLDASQLPTLFAEFDERSLRGARELEPQLLVCHQTADDSFNRSM
jgi:hypothetical protein